MNNQEASRIAAMTNEFYQSHARSFSDTRQQPWTGWTQAIASIPDITAKSNNTGEGEDSRNIITNNRNGDKHPLEVLDLACGNMRFSKFLAQSGISANVLGVDINDELAWTANFDTARADINYSASTSAANVSTNYANMDIISKIQGNSLLQSLYKVHPQKFDLAVCFGFFHHIPTTELRKKALTNLCSSVHPDGYIVISFWQFMRNEKIAQKAIQATKTAQSTGTDLNMQEGDYFLGWQGDCDTLRFCHNFSEHEIDTLLSTVNIEEVSRFSADGRSGDLNRYIVARV
jgi:2-polyprenyl-3-methyl-5-hydroxy-6-metoxy-1,4-benzoquinol methylase